MIGSNKKKIKSDVELKEQQTKEALSNELGETCGKLQAIFKASPVAIIALDIDGKVTMWSPGAEKIFGWSSQEVIGRFHPAINDKNREGFFHHFQKVIEGNSPLQEIISHSTKGGSLVDISVSGAHLIDSEDNVVGTMGVLQDVTQRIQDHKVIKESEQRYRNLLETMNEGFTVRNSEGEILYANKSFLEMIGYAEDEVIGSRMANFLDDHNKAIAVKQDKLQNSRADKPYELQWTTKRGQSIYTIVSPATYCDSLKVSSAVITNVTNIKSAQKKLQQREKELKVHKKNLEEINSALRVLLKKRDQDKKELEDKVLLNVKDSIMPILMKLRKRLSGKDGTYADILELNLNDIISPFTKNMSFKYLNLTPTELQVANFIKQGMKTKEIADFMNLSPKTIEDHRKHIRKKLGISNSKANLRSRLLFISEE